MTGDLGELDFASVGGASPRRAGNKREGQDAMASSRSAMAVSYQS
jgi:hypothetical protein